MSTQVRKPSFRTLLLTMLYLLIFPALLLLLSGDWLWIEGWIFTAWFLILCFSAILYLYRNDPALLAERFKKPGSLNQQSWDRYVVIGLNLGFVVWILVMPLDARRFEWTTGFPAWLQVVGGVALAFSACFLFRSYSDNTFLSPLVRIQADRKQRVVSTGVYGFVRHPMYLGGGLLFVGAPMLLGSAVGLAIGVAVILLLGGLNLLTFDRGVLSSFLDRMTIPDEWGIETYHLVNCHVVIGRLCRVHRCLTWGYHMTRRREYILTKDRKEEGVPHGEGRRRKIYLSKSLTTAAAVTRRL